MPSIGAFGSNAVGPRTDKPDYKDRESRPDYKDYKDRESRPDYKDYRDRDAKPVETEERKEVSKPVFTSSKKKPIVGGAPVEEIQSSKQNYDYSSLKVSASTNKVARPKEEGPAEGTYHEDKPRQRREYGDDDNRTFTKSSAKAEF